MAIRPATVDDVRAIAEIRVAGWRSAYAGLMEQHVLDALDPAAEAERRRREWGTRPSTTAVASLGGAVVGFVMTCPYRGEADQPDWPADPHAGEVAALYVDPAVHGQGVGRSLLSHALAQLAVDGSTVARLWTLAGNTRARRVYAAAGFIDESPAGVVTDYTPRGGTRATPEVRYSRYLADLAAPAPDTPGT